MERLPNSQCHTWHRVSCCNTKLGVRYKPARNRPSERLLVWQALCAPEKTGFYRCLGFYRCAGLAHGFSSAHNIFLQVYIGMSFSVFLTSLVSSRQPFLAHEFLSLYEHCFAFYDARALLTVFLSAYGICAQFFSRNLLSGVNLPRTDIHPMHRLCTLLVIHCHMF